MKKLILILMMAFAVAMISCSNEDITGNGGSPPPDITLATVPSPLPTENVWRITDATGTTGDFTALKAALIEADKAGRKIKLEFPNIVTIPASAFYDTVNSKGITSIVSVSAPLATSIGEQAFWECYGLTSITLPAATTIGDSAFKYCNSLTSITLPAATTIGDSAFNSCDSLTSITLPAATTIGDYAFSNCDDLTTMTIATESTLITLGNDAFNKVITGNITVTTSTANKDAGIFGNFKFKKVIGII